MRELRFTCAGQARCPTAAIGTHVSTANASLADGSRFLYFNLPDFLVLLKRLASFIRTSVHSDFSFPSNTIQKHDINNIHVPPFPDPTHSNFLFTHNNLALVSDS